MKLILLFACVGFTVTTVFGQHIQKKVNATQVTVSPKIDGVLDEEVWEKASVATDFIASQPVAGLHEQPQERTEVKIIYDNSAIFIGARMFETSKSKIAREIATRDSVGNADLFGVIFDTYKDGINGTGFFVTSANSQYDAKYSLAANGTNEDPNWNAVWTSQVKFDDTGWTVEMRIPYSALRFSKKEVQTWGINFIRKRQFAQQQLFWNEVDPKINGLVNQEGLLNGLENIAPPVRLAFYPYLSSNINHYPYNTPRLKNTTGSFNGGMDIKYGINESFTLDLTLIPDFGQVQSDNKILNLTPFEVKYNENRPFFTEGTELFNKGNLFYSRRIGGAPVNYNTVASNLRAGEELVSNPSETKLLNAVKLSGRTAQGLGIGFFNATTNSTYAQIQDSTGNKREVLTSPVVNYNILVFDQNLKNNSAITLINTNVTRFGKDYSADVGGLVYNLNNKANSYKLAGYAFMSNLYGPARKTATGYSYQLFGGKSSGNFTWNVSQTMVDSKYNANDLGLLPNNNYLDHEANLQYDNYHPKSYFNSWELFFNVYYSRRINSSSYQFFNQSAGGFVKFKNFWRLDLIMRHRNEGQDFYEPRIAGRLFKFPENYILSGELSTNKAEKVYLGLAYTTQWRLGDFSGKGTDVLFYDYIRLNNKFAISQNITYSPRLNYTGFSLISDGGLPIFALRNVNTVENILALKYTFRSDMGLNIRFRHYWSKLRNKEYFDIANNGTLTNLVSNDFKKADQNANIWNMDLIYVWQFQPGSEISLAWKTSSIGNVQQADQNYFYNLKTTINQPQNSNWSFKILYYIDFQNLKKAHANK